MGNSRGRFFLTGAISLAALASFWSTPATAAPVAEAPAAAPVEVRYTTTVAGKWNLLGLNLKPTAKVTDAVTGDPLAGVQVLFYLRNTEFIPHMCGGTTNAAGIATCGGVREQLYVLQKGGYRAYFGGQDVGDVYYRSSEDDVRVLGR